MANGTGAAAKGASTATKGAGGFAKWYAGHKPEALLGAAGLVVAVAAYVRSRQQAASSSSSTSPTATPSTSTVMPGSLAPFTGSAGGGGSDMTGMSSILLQLEESISKLGDQQAAAPSPVTAPPTPTPSPQTFGQGIVQTALGPMVWLGVTGAGGSTGADFQVGGGAPVYFGNAGSLAQGGTQQQGVDVYTPVAYESLVSAQPG